jgi:hypothetical protein
MSARQPIDNATDLVERKKPQQQAGKPSARFDRDAVADPRFAGGRFEVDHVHNPTYRTGFALSGLSRQFAATIAVRVGD